MLVDGSVSREHGRLEDMDNEYLVCEYMLLIGGGSSTGGGKV